MGLPPGRVAKLAAEMQAVYAQHIRDAAGGAEQRPRQLAELDARIDPLRERLRSGDPDLTPDELQGPGPDNSLWAEYEIRPGALVREETDGGPWGTCSVPTTANIVQRIRVK